MKKCIYVIRFGIMPWDDERMPLDVDDWLLPIFTTLSHLEGEMARKTSK